MEEKNMNNPRRQISAPGHGPRAGVPGEKVEKGTWGKLIGYCRRYIVVVAIAIICSAIGTVLTLVGPDKLSEMTDVITDGITPDTDKLEEIFTETADSIKGNMEDISTAVSENLSSNIEIVMSAISANLSNQEQIKENAAKVLADEGISDSDKQEFQSVLTGVSDSSLEAQIFSLPLDVLNVLFEEIEVDGHVISVEDQIAAIRLFGDLDLKDRNAAMTAVSSLPDSVRSALYTDIEINSITISGEDQQEMLKAFSGIEEEDIKEDMDVMSGALDSMPESVKSAMYTDITVAGVTISGKDQQVCMELMGSIDKDDTSAMLKALDSMPQSIYSVIKPSISLDKIAEIAILLVVFYGLSAVLSSGQGFIMATVTQKISKSMRSDISGKINRLPMSYYNRHSTGDVLSRVTNDVDTIGMTLNMSIGNLVHAVTLFAGSLIMMLKTNVIMTVTGILATIIGFVFMMLIMGRSQKYFVRQQRHLGAVNGHIEEIYAGHTVVKAYNGEESAEKEFRELNNKLRDSGFKAQALSGLMMPIMTFIGNFGYVAVCIVGASLALNGKITFGVIVAFMMYIRFFTQPLSQMAQAAQSLQSAGAAASRVFEFLEAEEMEDESQKSMGLTSALGNVSFSHVRFSYPDTPDKVIIKDFSAEVKAGQKIAIVGPTGAGKTTLVNLLMRFYEINGGDIRIDGVSTASMKREDVHSQFCMVLQDTWLFEGSVRENLVYCSENKSEEKMHTACQEVGLDHFIRTLPQGYDTVLDDSVSLSQGQKQQLTIARAMIADKPILILDEATSSIDTRTEQKIQKAMDELMNGRTSFVIAHRLSTIRNADLILVLKDGDVIESGNHEELMKQNGFYADLYNSQFEQSA